MMHAKKDMEQRHKMHAETYLRMASRSPTGSPSDVSLEEWKTTTYFHYGPVISPMGSPNRPESSQLRVHSPESSSGGLSVSTVSGPSHHSASSDGTQWSRCHGEGGKAMKEFEAVEVEMDEEDIDGSPCRHPFRLFILAIIVVFFLIDVILWVGSRFQEPKITMHSIAFEDFFIQAGIDNSAVPTMMATLKSTVSLTYHSPSFGVRVTSTSLDLSYLELRLATGKMDDFHQSKKSQRDLNVVVTGNKVPLYGAGSSLSSTRRPVPLTLSFSLRSTAHLVGVLVKSNFHTSIQCSVEMDRTKLKKPMSLMSSCRYS